ncbi:MAG: hypothetical protein ACOZF2_16540 [Thermodesulfobacteriota bacterium]
MQRKDLVSMFMESPFYFELTHRERLFLLQYLKRQCDGFNFGPHAAPVTPESPVPVMAPQPE